MYYMAFPQEAQLQTYIDPVLASYEVELERLNTHVAGAKSVVRVTIDADESPNSDVLESVSRDLSQAFDTAEQEGTLNFGPGYTLEVSTPGLETPLQSARRWRRNIGRLVKIPAGELNQGTDQEPAKKKKNQYDFRRVAGVFEQPDATSIALITPGKNPTVDIVALDDIPMAQSEVEFSKVPQAEQDLVGLDLPEYMKLTEYHA